MHSTLKNGQMEVTQLNDKIFTISDVLSLEECQYYIDYTEQLGYTPAPVTTSRGPKMMPDFRNNERVMYDDVALADMLWQRIQHYVPANLRTLKAVGLNERFRFYKYLPKQEFKEHMDGRFRRNKQEASLLTLLVYLNGDCKGGETKFLDITVAPQPGLALIFRHKVLHAGMPVIEGVKYVLRSDVMYSSALDG